MLKIKVFVFLAMLAAVVFSNVSFVYAQDENPPSDGGGGGMCAGGDAGPFSAVMQKIDPLARNAWTFGVGLLIIVSMLGGLYYSLQGAGGAATGASGMTSKAIIGIVGLVLLVLMTFLLLPEFAKMLCSSAPAAPW